MKTLQQQLNNIQPVSADIMDIFCSHWQVQTLAKDGYLVKENTIANRLFFVKKGIARIYYYKNEKEITEWIALDGTFCFSILSFFVETPSRLIIQVIEPSEIWSITKENLMKLCDSYHEIEKLFRQMITGSLILSQYRVDSLQFETAQQRYDQLLKNNPSIVQRVPLSYIASFLGITQETLSRIRALK